jgi:hypothetical protein
MGGDHDRLSGDLGDLVSDGNSLRAKVVEDSRVVYQIAEDGERLGLGVAEGQGDGVTNAKAHAKMMSADNLHRASKTDLDGFFRLTCIHFVMQS